MSEITYNDLITLTRWMAQNGYSADDVAYAIEKPHKYLDELKAAKGDELAAARLKKDA